MAGTLTVSGHSATEPAGERNFGPVTIQGKGAGATYVRPLVIGDNRFEVPAEMVAAWIVPPTGNSAELKVRTNQNEGDGGLLVSETNPTLFALPSTAPTVLILHASAGVASPTSIVFI